ncbi:MAG: S-layer homology domain-containing protein [Arthrobacter sp.]
MTRTRPSLARGRTKLVTIVLAVGALAAALLTPGVANAAVNNAAPSALVSFTFDDGSLSSFTQAAPTLQKHGLTGTNYVITNCVGMTTVPNSCRADGDVPYMTWTQIKQLQTQYGWEIGSHGLDHQCLVSTGGDCQDSKLTVAQVDEQMANSRSALAGQGITATAFAPPYGDYDQTVIAKVAKYYSSMRGFKDEGLNLWPLSDYLVNNVAVQEGLDTVATLKAKVDEAINNKTWTVFTFHGIVPTPSADPDDYQFGTAELDELAAYVKSKVTAGQIKNVNVSTGLVTGTPNKMPNASFNSGIGEGWRTDAPATITADAAGNGSYPDPTRSVKLMSGAAFSHLFSPQVAVTPGTNYLYKAFLNVAAITTGEVGFYVDEYNSAGGWISGQFRTRENTRWVESMNFAYTPSSTDVASASLQILVTGTGITAYLDNVEMLALGAETQDYVPPAVSPFADVPTSHGFYKEIAWLADRKISQGWPGANNTATFRPASNVNRDQMAAFLYRMSATTGYTAPAVSPFTDVPTSHGFYKEIAWLAEQKISQGWPGANNTATFRPGESINRDQMAAFLYRMSGPTGYTAPAVSPFTDVPTSHTFYKEIAWLADRDISKGWPGANNTATYQAGAKINRDQMAAFLFRMSNPTAG